MSQLYSNKFERQGLLNIENRYLKTVNKRANFTPHWY